MLIHFYTQLPNIVMIVGFLVGNIQTSLHFICADLVLLILKNTVTYSSVTQNVALRNKICGLIRLESYLGVRAVVSRIFDTVMCIQYLLCVIS